MNFQRMEHHVLKQTSNHEEVGLKRPLASFKSYSHVEDLNLNNQNKGSQPLIDENKKSQIISFKQGFARKRTLSGKITDMKHSAVFGTDSPLNKQKKSLFSSQFQPKSAGLKPKKLVEFKRQVKQTEQPLLHTSPSVTHFKKKVTFTSSGANEEEISIPPPKLQFNKSISRTSSRSMREQMKKQICLEQFQKGKFLGKGIYGQVVQVKHKLTGWVMAMKIINKQNLQSNQKLTNQIVQEIKIHSFINHPNICSMYGFFCDETNIYLLLELCSDKSLYSLMKAQRGSPVQNSVQLINQVTDSLDYLHFNDIIHRDIKPENILLSYDMIKLTDFGWSAHCINGMRNTVCGTPLYLSPQLVKGEQYNNQCDIWALGILSYELLCGKTPFKIMDRNQLNKIISDNITFPENLNISNQSKDFVIKCLEKDQEHRASILELKAHPFLRPAIEQLLDTLRRFDL